MTTPGPPRRATTLRDVALAAGVSIKTVSNVVNDHPHVRAELRSKVQELITELDYRPSATGRQLRRGRTGAVAVALPNVTSPFYGELTSTLVRSARARGLTVLVELTDGEVDREREVSQGFPVRSVDGMIFAPLAIPTSELALRRDTTPAVLLGENGEGAGLDRVTLDSVAVAELATRHLLEQGRRRIAFLGDKTTSAERSPVVAQRVAGYRKALRRARIRFDADLLQATPEWERQFGADAVTALLARCPDVDGIVAANDLVALGALHALRRNGRRVPDDVALIGIDDVEEARFATPTLSSVGLDRAAMAELAFDLLNDRLDGYAGPPRLVTAAHYLSVRESTGG